MDRRIERLGMPSSVVAAVVLMATLAIPAEAGPYSLGDPITITGQVTDTGGTPLAGVTVILEPARREFKLSKPFQRQRNREATDHIQLLTVTDEAGSYRFDWVWDRYYNSFSLAVASESGERGELEILQSTEITDRLQGADSVEMTLRVDDTTLPTTPRRWMPPPIAEVPPADTLPPPPVVWPESEIEESDLRDAPATERGQTTDEQRILSEMGEPERLDSHERLSGTETSWWYFTEGKVYHFLDGELSQVMHFDPIPAPP